MGAMPVAIVLSNCIPVLLAVQTAALNQELHLSINNSIYIVMECLHSLFYRIKIFSGVGVTTGGKPADQRYQSTFIKKLHIHVRPPSFMFCY